MIKPLVLLKLLFLLLLFIFPPIKKINKQSTGLEKQNRVSKKLCTSVRWFYNLSLHKLWGKTCRNLDAKKINGWANWKLWWGFNYSTPVTEVSEV